MDIAFHFFRCLLYGISNFADNFSRKIHYCLHNFCNQSLQQRNRRPNNIPKQLRLFAVLLHRFLYLVRDFCLFQFHNFHLGHAAYDCTVNSPVPFHADFIVRLYFLRFRVIFANFLGRKIRTVFIKYTEPVFIINHHLVD